MSELRYDTVFTIQTRMPYRGKRSVTSNFHVQRIPCLGAKWWEKLHAELGLPLKQIVICLAAGRHRAAIDRVALQSSSFPPRKEHLPQSRSLRGDTRNRGFGRFLQTVKELAIRLGYRSLNYSLLGCILLFTARFRSRWIR